MRALLICGLFAYFQSPIVYAQEAGDPISGQRTFAICKSCHQLGRNSIGPNLIGVVGRRAASYEDFSYSLALRNSHIVWDEANLQSWLKNPSAKVPGTKMLFQGFSDDKKITNVIAYLKTLK